MFEIKFNTAFDFFKKKKKAGRSHINVQCFILTTISSIVQGGLQTQNLCPLHGNNS